MNTRTYYDTLGVPATATLEEITNAKNALAKVYHPDANIHSGIDTTSYMQEILEAYQTLSDIEKKKHYDQIILGTPNRVFKTYTMDAVSEDEQTTSFVTYWNIASRLNDAVELSIHLVDTASASRIKRLPMLNRILKNNQYKAELSDQLQALSAQVMQYITILTASQIPVECWQPEAMNWVLVRWGQHQNADYLLLFQKYQHYVEQHFSPADKLKLRSRNRRFQHHLKKLLAISGKG